MDEGETKTCENCKRDIPCVNFTTHAVHCARNLRVCPVCKEPVPLAELPDHHDKLHKPLPCAQCGESVCGTDLEDHVRDSCAHTMKTCRFCALELRRGELPAHERFCGARTERCEQCGEWVMHKYRQLHLDSNHGFLRLDDDPVPTDIANKTTNVPKPSPNVNSSRPDCPTGDRRPPTEIRYLPPSNSDIPNTSKPLNISNGINDSSPRASGSAAALRSVSSARPASSRSAVANGLGCDSTTAAALARAEQTQHKLNTTAAAPDKVAKDLWASRGAVKKRPAPKPPARPAPPDPRRDSALRSALQRQQHEETQRREQTAHNLALGLPPVLSAAAKLDKLRKMDALHNRPDEQPDISNVLQGRVWRAPDVPVGHVLGAADAPELRGAEPERVGRHALRGLTPMSGEQFAARFNELQLRRPDDRYSQIRSSLQELRRGLNEVTAPYNCAASSVYSGEERLPCEFCGELVLPDDLVQHQTGCRPDLTQYRPKSRSGSRHSSRSGSRHSSRAGSRTSSRAGSPPPVIPCEFCTAPLPVYLINEHQERCGRDANLLFPD